jgi:protein-tyrosine phosphatase
LLSEKGPVSYNCTAGQDRTGVATALILSALGVPRQTILNDYHLSTVYRRPENEMPAVDPTMYPGNPVAALFAKGRLMKPQPLYSEDGRSFMAAMYDRIDGHWGSVENYLDQVLGVGPTELARLRAHYLE